MASRASRSRARTGPPQRGSEHAGLGRLTVRATATGGAATGAARFLDPVRAAILHSPSGQQGERARGSPPTDTVRLRRKHRCGQRPTRDLAARRRREATQARRLGLRATATQPGRGAAGRAMRRSRPRPLRPPARPGTDRRTEPTEPTRPARAVPLPRPHHRMLHRVVRAPRRAMVRRQHPPLRWGPPGVRPAPIRPPRAERCPTARAVPLPRPHHRMLHRVVRAPRRAMVRRQHPPLLRAAVVEVEGTTASRTTRRIAPG